MARLGFRRYHRNWRVSNGSDGLHRTTFHSLRIAVPTPQSIFYTSGFILWLDSNRLDCPSGFIARLLSIGLQGLSRLDFRRSLVSGPRPSSCLWRRSAGSFPEQRLVIEPRVCPRKSSWKYWTWLTILVQWRPSLWSTSTALARK